VLMPECFNLQNTHTIGLSHAEVASTKHLFSTLIGTCRSLEWNWGTDST